MSDSKNEIYYCTMQYSQKCKNKHGILEKKDFYTIKNSIFFKNERGHICKECMKDYIYVGKDVNIDRFKRILRLLDIPFFRKDYESAIADSKETIGTYMKNIYLNHKDKTWEDSDELGYGEEILDDTENTSFVVTKEMKRVWGRGHNVEDYEWLEETYNEWISKYNHDTLAEQKTFRSLTLKEWEIMRGREEGKSVDKMEETYRKFMSDANVVPRDANAASDSENVNMLGLWTRDIERYRPAEYFKDKKIYKDFDGIVDYLTRFVFRPLKNLLTGSREFDKEFNVEDDEPLNEDEEDGDISG